MKAVLLRSLLFAGFAFGITLVADLLASSSGETRRTGYFATHALFHGAVFAFSALGAFVGLVAARGGKLSWLAMSAAAVAYGVATIVVSLGAILMSGRLALVAWLFLGSFSFVLGAALSRKPWRRPAL